MMISASALFFIGLVLGVLVGIVGGLIFLEKYVVKLFMK